VLYVPTVTAANHVHRCLATAACSAGQFGHLHECGMSMHLNTVTSQLQSKSHNIRSMSSAHMCVSDRMCFADETISSRAAVYAICEPVHSEVC